MPKFIEIPILGGVVAVDQITAIRHHDGSPAYGGPPTMPRVIIDTRQLTAAFIIECDTHATMIGVLRTLTLAVIKADQGEVAETLE